MHQAAGDENEFTDQRESWVENPRRVDSILKVLSKSSNVRIQIAKKHTLEETVLLVHADDFVSWLRRYWATWKNAGEPAQFGDGDCGLLPDSFRYSCCDCAQCPTVQTSAGSSPAIALLNQAGWWSFDRNAPVLEHTFLAACAAADTALTAAKLLLEDCRGVVLCFHLVYRLYLWLLCLFCGSFWLGLLPPPWCFCFCLWCFGWVIFLSLLLLL